MKSEVFRGISGRTATVYVGDALAVLRELPAEFVHCCVTSPPYWGLRDYGTEPLVWGGDLGCEHEWDQKVHRVAVGRGDHGSGPDSSSNLSGNTVGAVAPGPQAASGGAFCLRCSAWRGSLGLEPTPELYVEHLVIVFREVWRVLRDDGTLWVNLGDSYSNAGTRQGDRDGGVSNGRVNDHRAFYRPTAPGLKNKDLVGIPWRVAFALQADGWYLRSDIIWAKCLSGGAWVYARTQKGEMPMMVKDLSRLAPSTVQLWNGAAWTALMAMSRTDGRAGALEIELRNGERIGCTSEHRWPTGRGLIEARDLVLGDIIAAVPLPEPATPRMPAGLDDADVGWFVGTYLADGSMSGDTIQVASGGHETERLKRLRAVAEAFDGTCRAHRTSARGMTVNLQGRVLIGILGAYIGGRTAVDKHLAPRCWMRSNVFLRALLDGYLQGDGHEVAGRWILGFCANDALARDLRVVAARLGASLRLRRTFHSMNGRKFPGWRGSLYFEALRRKQSDTQIVAIRKSRARQFWEIAVVAEPHVFALGCGALTHNSNPMPESVTDRPTKAHEYLFLLAKSERYYYDAEAVAEPQVATPGPRRDRGGSDGYIDLGMNSGRAGNRSDGLRNRRTVWTIATHPYSEAHFATFPPDLVKPCVLAGCLGGGVVLDPFAGSGTTLAVAVEYKRDAIGVELNPAYVVLIGKRVRAAGVDDPLGLFG